METKISKLKAAFYAGDYHKALSIANKFHELGQQRDAIKSAAGAILSPEFYKSIGKDPEALIEEGITAIRNRYHL